MLLCLKGISRMLILNLIENSHLIQATFWHVLWFFSKPIMQPDAWKFDNPTFGKNMLHWSAHVISKMTYVRQFQSFGLMCIHAMSCPPPRSSAGACSSLLCS